MECNIFLFILMQAALRRQQNNPIPAVNAVVAFNEAQSIQLWTSLFHDGTEDNAVFQ